MRGEATGTLTLNNDELTFTNDDGEVQFQSQLSDIKEIKDYNTLQLDLRTQDNKLRLIFFSTVRGEIIIGGRFGNYKQWYAANEQAQTILKPWLDVFQRQGILVHGRDKLKSKKSQNRMLVWFMLISVGLIIVYILFQSFK